MVVTQSKQRNRQRFNLCPTCRRFIKRYNRLDYLRVLTEGYIEGEGCSIFKKALRAGNKNENFTGIIRLSHIEKEFLSYMLDGADDPKDIETLNYYIRV